MTNILNFDKYLDSLFESMNSPKNIEWKEKGEKKWLGYFNVDKHKYMIRIFNNGNSIYSGKFFIEDENKDWSPDMIGENKATNTMIVMSTIKKAYFEFFEIVDINAMVISSTGNSKGKRFLYNLFCNECIKMKPNFIYEKKSKVHSKNIENNKLKENISVLYIIYKNDFDLNLLNQTINDIIVNDSREFILE
jgi:hypothetical protein